ncbi:hypothetical protein [Komagataeibacter xylinus]|uniref:hypothetical protein n=1 Tax=Komagataeibacter xylinus TaxID=28448 RepID=UPI0013EED839|nr:hypothetical protein [Komagataeibacter xylinus]
MTAPAAILAAMFATTAFTATVTTPAAILAALLTTATFTAAVATPAAILAALLTTTAFTAAVATPATILAALLTTATFAATVTAPATTMLAASILVRTIELGVSRNRQGSTKSKGQHKCAFHNHSFISTYRPSRDWTSP